MAFYAPVGCVRFAGYCGKVYSCHRFPSGGLKEPQLSGISYYIVKQASLMSCMHAHAKKLNKLDRMGSPSSVLPSSFFPLLFVCVISLPTPQYRETGLFAIIKGR